MRYGTRCRRARALRHQTSRATAGDLNIRRRRFCRNGGNGDVGWKSQGGGVTIARSIASRSACNSARPRLMSTGGGSTEESGQRP
eukprot:scaffold28138_cov28-Tisochrysis_lutea.AAC.4